MLKFAFEKAFTDANIKAAFRNTSIWPIDKLELLSRPLPACNKNLGGVLNVEEMCGKLERKRRESRTKILGEEAELMSNGLLARSREWCSRRREQ